MNVKVCCNNCGFVGEQTLPYRAKITAAKIELRITEFPSSFETDGGKSIPFLCTNCGIPELEVVYWNGTKAKSPFIGEILRVEKNGDN